MNELTVRQALAARLDAIPGVTAYPRRIGQFTGDVAMVDYPEPMTYGEVLGARVGSAVFPVTLYVSHKEGGAAEARLAALLDEDDPDSVPAAIDADASLGGIVASIRAVETRNYGPTTINDVAVLAVDVLVEVLF